MPEGNVESKFWGSLGLYDKVSSGERLVMAAGILSMGVDEAVVAASAARSYTQLKGSLGDI